MSQRRILPGYEGLATACGAWPHWISRKVDLPARMRCVRRAGHPGKHVNAQDHGWKKS